MCHDHAFVFLKTRKTAGTSVEMALEPFCRPPGAAVTEKSPTHISRHGIVGRRLSPPGRFDRLLGRKIWRNHATAAQVAAKLGPDRWHRYAKVTSVRNPFSMAISAFHWRMERHGPVGTGDELRTAFKAFLRGDYLASNRKIVHLNGKYVCDFAVRAEHIAEDLAHVVREVTGGSVALEVPHTKSKAGKAPRDLSTYYDDEAINLVHDSCGWIFEHFDYPQQPFQTMTREGA